MAKIRDANLDDIDWVIPELKHFSDTIRCDPPLFSDEETVRQQLTTVIEKHLFLVSETIKGECSGLIAGVYAPHYLNPSVKILNELLWWVREEHRRSRAGLELLNEFINRGRQRVDWVLFTLEKQSPVNERCLIKRGFKPMETSYLYEVNKNGRIHNGFSGSIRYSVS